MSEVDEVKTGKETSDSFNKKETIPDSRCLIDAIEMQGKENRNMEWCSKAERRMKEIKEMNIWDALWVTDAETAEEKDIKERERKGVSELTKEWDTNKEAESGKWSEEQLEREIDREEDRMYIVFLNLQKASQRQHYLKEFGQLAEKRSKLVCAQNKEAVLNQDSFLTDFKEMKEKWLLEQFYWEMTSQVTLEKIGDYLVRLEELKQGRNIVDLSDKTKPGKLSQKESSVRLETLEYLFFVKEMSVSTDSEVIVDLEQKRESSPFQVSEKEIHSNDEEMEIDLYEEVFLILGPYNILKDDANEHLKNGIIIQLVDFGCSVYERIKDLLSNTIIKPIFLVYTKLKENTLHMLPPETVTYGMTGIIRVDERKTNRIEKFKCRNPKPIPDLNLDATELLCKIKEEKIFSRVMLRIAIDSLTEEILASFLNNVYAEQILLFKQKLALLFQNEFAAQMFGNSVRTLCTGASPDMHCVFAGFDLLEQIINQRKTNKVSFWRCIPDQLPEFIEEINKLNTFKLKKDFLCIYFKGRENNSMEFCNDFYKKCEIKS